MALAASGNALTRSGACFVELGQRLAQDRELSFDGGAQDLVSEVFVERLSGQKALYGYAAGLGVPEQGARITCHAAARDCALWIHARRGCAPR